VSGFASATVSVATSATVSSTASEPSTKHWPEEAAHDCPSGQLRATKSVVISDGVHTEQRSPGFSWPLWKHSPPTKHDPLVTVNVHWPEPVSQLPTRQNLLDWQSSSDVQSLVPSPGTVMLPQAPMTSPSTAEAARGPRRSDRRRSECCMAWSCSAVGAEVEAPRLGRPRARTRRAELPSADSEMVYTMRTVPR
jgi:hypothetical protein